MRGETSGDKGMMHPSYGRTASTGGRRRLGGTHVSRREFSRRAKKLTCVQKGTKKERKMNRKNVGGMSRRRRSASRVAANLVVLERD